MNQIKRELDSSQFFNKETKKLRRTFDDKNKSITFIETLSNEVFFEVFEYLDGCDIFDAFSNLNFRFQELLNSSALLLKITLCSKSKSLLEHRCKCIVIPNKRRIVSLKLMDNEPNDLSYELFTISALFHRLESLALYNTPTVRLKSILIHLHHLPRLFSLTIHHKDLSKEFNDIYSLILDLPLLKYCKLSLKSDMKLPLLLGSNLQNNSIQHLVFCESWYLKKLIALLSYTPQLNRLVCKKLIGPRKYIDRQKFFTLSNLTHISIGTCYMEFETFETFIKKISSQLQVLRIKTRVDPAYSDADRWERLISKYIPHLRILDFQYKEPITYIRKTSSFARLINRFNSPFWAQRQWFLEIKIDEYERFNGLIIYSICPSKKGWYEFSEHMANDKQSSQNMIQHSVTSNRQDLISEKIQLTLIDLSFVDCIKLFMDLINPIFIVAQITRLAVNFNISIYMLSQFIHRLPNLNSLILWGWSPLESNFGFTKQENIENKILKVC